MARPPRLYDRLVGPVVRLGALQNVPVGIHDGNVFASDPEINSIDDGWRSRDHRRIGKILGTTAAVAAAAAVARRLGTPPT